MGFEQVGLRAPSGKERIFHRIYVEEIGNLRQCGLVKKGPADGRADFAE